MKNPKLNSGAANSVPENAGEVKNYDTLKRNFETAYAIGNYGEQMKALAMSTAYSVVRKCADPQRKTAPERNAVSDNGQNPAMTALRRGITADMRLLDLTAENANKVTRATLDKNGEPVTEIADREAETALAGLIEQTLSDGVDLVQEACVALLEQAEKHATTEPSWLDKPYTIRKLDKRVYIRLDDSAAYKEVETTPIQEVFRAVRRVIASSRAVQTDPRNGYTYIEDVTPDGLDTILYRSDKYADIGGTDCNGLYTGDIETVRDIYGILDQLDLTKRQEQVIKLRMRGMGYKAISTYLGIDLANTKRTVKQVQAKAEKIGFTPDMWREMTENGK